MGSKGNDVNFQTSLVVDIYDYVSTFAESVSGQLSTEKLFEVFQMLAMSVAGLIKRLADKCDKDAAQGKVKEFYKIIIRLNDTCSACSKFETFKALMLSKTVDSLYRSTEEFFKQQDNEMLNSRDRIVHAVGQIIVRQQI